MGMTSINLQVNIMEVLMPDIYIVIMMVEHTVVRIVIVNIVINIVDIITILLIMVDIIGLVVHLVPRIRLFGSHVTVSSDTTVTRHRLAFAQL